MRSLLILLFLAVSVAAVTIAVSLDNGNPAVPTTADQIRSRTLPERTLPAAARQETEETHKLVTGLTCGVARWTVKTLQDAPALRLRAKTATVAAMDALAVPSPLTATRSPGEYQVYRLANVTLDRFKLENDSDIHLGITQAGAHTIIEFPNPACAPKTPPKLLARMAAARTALTTACGDPPPGQIHSTALHGGTATVTGVLFFDYKHSKFPPFDAAPNAVELHPALSFKLTSARC
jgi:hypothetical protein